MDFQLNPFCFRSGWQGLSFSDVGSLCRSTRAGLLLHLLRIDLENFLEMGQRPVAESGKKRRMVGGCSLLARVGSTWNEQERQLQLLVRPRHLQTGIRCKWSRCRTGRLLVATLDFHFNIQRTEKDSIAYSWYFLRPLVADFFPGGVMFKENNAKFYVLSDWFTHSLRNFIHWWCKFRHLLWPFTHLLCKILYK